MKYGWFHIRVILIVPGPVGVFIHKHKIFTPKKFSENQVATQNILPRFIQIIEQEVCLEKQQLLMYPMNFFLTYRVFSIILKPGNDIIN